MKIEAVGGKSGSRLYWTVLVDPHELRVASGKTLPYSTWIGTFGAQGRMNVWTPAASVPRGYKEAATKMLQAARDQTLGGLIHGSDRARGTTERSATFIKAEMLDGILQALWLPAWASWAEENGISLSQMRIEDIAPTAPKTAIAAAKKYAAKLAAANHSLMLIYQRALAAEGKPIKAEKLGYYITMQGLGHGVSWEDDHAAFEVKTPRVEAIAYKQRGRFGLDVSM